MRSSSATGCSACRAIPQLRLSTGSAQIGGRIGAAQLVRQGIDKSDQASYEQLAFKTVAILGQVVDDLRRQGARRNQDTAPDLARLHKARIGGVVAEGEKIARLTPTSGNGTVSSGIFAPNTWPP
jgi:hypothetical protein